MKLCGEILIEKLKSFKSCIIKHCIYVHTLVSCT